MRHKSNFQSASIMAWSGISLLVISLFVVLDSHRWVLIGPALHLRTIAIALVPLLVLVPLAETLLSRFKSYASLTAGEKLLFLGFSSAGLASAVAFTLLTLRVGYGLTFIIFPYVLLLIYWPWWKKKVLSLPSITFNLPEGHPERLFIAVALLLLLGAALLPPLGYDAHEYHLAVPESYLSAGGWVSFQSNVYAAFPMNVEMLYLWPIASKSIAGCTVINFYFALLAALATALYVKRLTSGTETLMPFLLFLSTGLVIRLVLQANIDLALAASAILLLYAYERFREETSALDLCMMIVALGFALGSKYIAVLSIAAPFGVMVLGDALWNRRVDLIKTLLLVVVGGGILFAPWLIRNWVLYHNPVYPLLYATLGGTPNFYYELFDAAHASSVGSWTQFISTPFTKSLSESLPMGFSALGLLILPTLLLIRKMGSVSRLWLFVLTSYSGWFFLTQQNDRFLASTLPLLAIFPVVVLWKSESPILRSFLRSGILVIVAIQLWAAVAVIVTPDTVGYLTSPSFDETYLAKRHPHYRAIDWLNRSLNVENRSVHHHVDRVLFVGEAQSYGALFEVTAPTVFNFHPLGLEPIRLDRRISHILYNRFELERLSTGYGPLGWPLGDKLQSWIDENKGTQLKKVYDAYPEKPDWIVVYQVVR